jgi:acyl-coenzyme A synthetase/AMP-(fatty) acid ligase
MRMVLDAGVLAEDLASVRAVTTGAAPLNPDLKDEFERVYGVAVLNLYGATEFAGGVTGWTIRDWEQFRGDKRGSVGRANPGVRLRVVDEQTRQPVPAGETGVLEVGSDRFDTVDWVPTSDLGRLDEDGFLWIVGRLDDVIIRGGFKIQAEDVRIALESHPAVREAAVVGIPDDRLGEVPVAVVVLTDVAAREDTVVEQALREHLRARLTAYQVPVEIRVVRELPRTAALKVPKPAVRALFGHIS